MAIPHISRHRQQQEKRPAQRVTRSTFGMWTTSGYIDDSTVSSSAPSSADRDRMAIPAATQETVYKRLGKTTKDYIPDSCQSLPRRKTTSIFDENLQEKLVSSGIYPAGVMDAGGRIPRPSNNRKKIRRRLEQERQSLSGSPLEDLFGKFSDERRQARCKQDVAQNVLPLIEGSNSGTNTAEGLQKLKYECHTELRFDNLSPLLSDKEGLNMVQPKPDRVYTSAASTLQQQIREDLSKTIRPTKDLRGPDTILPNFSLEIKGPHGSARVAERQAWYNGTFGCRAMHALRSYPQPGHSTVYDGDAYAMSSTFESDSATLTLYSTYPRASAGSGKTRGPEYVTGQVGSWSLRGDPESFQAGVATFRNARDWARERREEAIASAKKRLADADADVDGSESEKTAKKRRLE